MRARVGARLRRRRGAVRLVGLVASIAGSTGLGRSGGSGGSDSRGRLLAVRVGSTPGSRGVRRRRGGGAGGVVVRRAGARRRGAGAGSAHGVDVAVSAGGRACRDLRGACRLAVRRCPGRSGARSPAGRWCACAAVCRLRRRGRRRPRRRSCRVARQQPEIFAVTADDRLRRRCRRPSGWPCPRGRRAEVPAGHPDQQHHHRGEEHQREALDQRVAAVDQDVLDAGDLGAVEQEVRRRAPRRTGSAAAGRPR